MTVDRSEAIALFRRGRLHPAIAAATELVKRHPGDATLRISLAEYLLFTGSLERADALLAGAEAVDGELAIVVAEFRQLLRGANRRRRLATEGQPPEFIGEPTEMQTALLRAAVALRAGDRPAAAEAAEAAEAARRPLSGRHDDLPFDDFRDADDTIGGNIEVFTTTGRFFWIDAANVLSMQMHEPRRPRDLIWRRCTMSVRNGPDGDVYLPALYDSAPAAAPPAAAGASPTAAEASPAAAEASPAAAEASDDALALGHVTEWDDAAPVRGRGQRILLLGDAGVPFHELRHVEFAP
ncbi:MAG: SciE type virulence protein [Gluconacetobacter diazotrophicus]|nr:SciE type virulence protein [Gluconacetobacter diazotrophicus]